MEDTWRDKLEYVVDTGRYWRSQYGDEFDKEKFITRSDTVYLCKKAQSDLLDELMLKFPFKKNELEGMKKELWAKDDSALGM